MRFSRTGLTLIFVLLIAACNNGSQQADQHAPKIYTCPMHPQIIRDKPGQCPICGMNLVEKKTEGEAISDSNLSILLKPTSEYVISSIDRVKMVDKTLPFLFEANGYITYDPTMINTVSARVSGRIEKLYVKYRFQQINKGDRLMDIYSKDLLTEEDNYLFLLKNDNENLPLIAAAENKLILMGLTKEQVAELKQSGKPNPAITIFSPYSGHLHDISAIQQPGTMDGRQMPQELQIHEGMYVEKGQTVFNIYSTTKVRAILSIFPEGLNNLRTEQEVKLHIDGIDDSIKAKIDFIEPSLQQNANTATARVYLDNPDGKIKVGAIVKATITGKPMTGKFLPSTAVLSLGTNNVVFLFQGGLFKATLVKPGSRMDGWIEILSGLSEKDEVAKNAQLLVDSESFIKTDKP